MYLLAALDRTVPGACLEKGWMGVFGGSEGLLVRYSVVVVVGRYSIENALLELHQLV